VPIALDSRMLTSVTSIIHEFVLKRVIAASAVVLVVMSDEVFESGHDVMMRSSHREMRKGTIDA
jgi:hypothetical protein